MKKLIICAALIVGALGASAQTKDGGISADMLSRISKSYTGSAEQKAIRNALSSNSIAALSVNAEALAMIDTHFSAELARTGGIEIIWVGKMHDLGRACNIDVGAAAAATLPEC